ncbi:MAG: hypothetical protein K8I82_04530, partial [Anaerolineae bacterium]|nr:hypothetical protein [Anaerolineae bacterium]
MNKEQLLENMNRLGIPLMVPEKAVDVEATLAQVILSHDPRLWEVFPGLLANIVEKHPVDLQAVADRLPLSSDKEALYRLCALA